MLKPNKDNTEYKNSSKTNVVRVNDAQVNAWSYKWWEYVRTINGKVVFNNARYSKTTMRLQRETRQLLKSLGIRIDLEVSCPAGLQSAQAFESIEKTIQGELERLAKECAKPRSRATVNAKRKYKMHRLTSDLIAARYVFKPVE
jgi:hypothetical protein